MAKLVVSENFSLFGFLLGRKRLVGSLYVKVEQRMLDAATATASP